jgi:predicted esterase
MKYLVGFAILFATFSTHAFADGKGDNDPANVRRVPKDGVEIPADRESKLRDALKVLQRKIVQLEASNDAETIALLPDVTIFERAVRVALDHGEFFSPKDIDKADQLLVEGISRADQLLAGKAEWPNQSGLVVRGYVSRIDHTVQPYALVVPETYAFNHSVPTRCDLWFHGRGETLSEVNFIWGGMKTAGQYTPDHTIMLHPYGRYSNAFKFAGEVDVLEALEDVQQRYRIDEDRISVRGFSMGGAACWQFAVHYADRWFAANPGAGFSETPQFLKSFQQETLNPTPWEKSLWNMYDCDKYALNLAHCPTIAYSGENDSQKQAADVMEEALKRRGMRLRHVIGADMGHKIDDASKQVIENDMRSLAVNGRTVPITQLNFETSTLKYNRLHWLIVDGLEQHWKRAYVEASLSFNAKRFVNPPRVRVKPHNVSAFTLKFPAGTFSSLGQSLDGVRIGQTTSRVYGANDFECDVVPFTDGSAEIQAHRDQNGVWKQGPPESGLRKVHGLQGPIDDAFMDSFVFVRPTGTAANEAAGEWAASELERAIEHWRRHFRGDARVVNDTDVTEEMIQSANLVLWGDPSSNSVMAKVAEKLPVKWTEKQIVVGDKTYDAAHHAPILIYPNPLNPDRYVVFNSSFTFREYAYLNNARQVPMLPDWAVIDLRTPPGNVWPGKVAAADFFDEQWQLKTAVK